MDTHSDLHQLIELFEFWFLPDTQKFCFNSTPEFDKIITEKYQILLNNYTYDKIQKYELNNITEDYRKAIGLIILHDQIPRHIFRTDFDKINFYLTQIINFAEKTYTRFKYDFKSLHFCFVLLPLRHLNNFDKIMFVISETKIKIKQNPSDLEYKRFFKATLERYIKLNTDIENLVLQKMTDQPHYIRDDTQICSDQMRKYHVVPFTEINLKDLPEHIINMINIVKKKSHIKKGIISLSGGVDSMILSYILKYIGIDICAVHINYNNRPECEEECIILRQWCSFLNIKLYIRKIIEIQRPEMMDLNMRDLYETYTRDIRFSTYVNAGKNELIMKDNIFVFLGHNHDDQFENIFTNIVSESHFENLCGMDVYTTKKFKMDNIIFVRPMLEISKSDIYKFASYFSIPHFKDSTPKWSQRGKIRDIIRPSIEQWDSRAVTSFFTMSEKLTDLIRIAKFSVDKMCDKIKTDGTLEIILDDIYPKTMFEMIFEQLQIKISQKSLTAFYEKLIFIKEHKKKYKINSIEKYRLNKETLIKWKNMDNNKIILYFT